ncbi:hypothetical protein [Jonesia quinghaiensis]|uniref:hypothetical protein n=1 Tax=Jonesia quinghaiensis TaxID=262806 RepID=UPI00041D3FAE|nr:hypothetical protein [Jonesia quinghaiensis]
MRIAVSGTHGSGKSTLIADYLTLHPTMDHYDDPYTYLDDAADPPGVIEYVEQLRISVNILQELPADTPCIIERTPLDFLAYLKALHELGRTSDHRFSSHLEETIDQALSRLDLLVVLPLEHHDPIALPGGEDLDLRVAMNEALLELVDTCVLATTNRVTEIFGSRDVRLVKLLQATGTRIDTHNS